MTRARIITLLIMLVAGTLSAQTTADQQISGTVVDSTGAAVPNATVTVTNEGTGTSRSTNTNSEGFYVITNIPNGTYRVSASAPGFKTYVSQNVNLSVGAKLNVNATLQVGDVSETVEVQAQALAVETTTGEVGHVITGAEAVELQMNGRNFIQLVSLAPGVSTMYTSGFSLYGSVGPIGGGQSINGSRPDSVTHLLNGSPNKDDGGPHNSLYVNPSPDFIAEFRTVASAQNAQYGLNAGGSVVTVLKSGSRQFHGSLYEYLRNDAIQARSFNALTKQPLRYNNFGGSIGGPVVIPGIFNDDKQKAFFFFGADYKRNRTTSITAWNVPRADQRNGSDPNGTALVNLYPLPSPAGSCTGGNFCFSSSRAVNVSEYVVKGDYYASQQHQLSGHFILDQNSSISRAGTIIEEPHGNPGSSAGFQWTWIINPTTVNTASVAFAGKKNVAGELRPNSSLGFNTLNRSDHGLTYPRFFDPFDELPNVRISGFTNLDFGVIPQLNYTQTYSVRDDFSKVLQNHTLRFGILIARDRKNAVGWGNRNGTFQFASLQNALAGQFFSYTEGSARTEPWSRGTTIEPYIQDDWKVNQRLTFNLGLRWAYMPYYQMALSNASAFDPDLYDAAQAPVISPVTGQITSALGTYNPYNGLFIPGSGFPESATVGGRVDTSVLNNPAVQALFRSDRPQLANTDFGTWSPRIGFALDLTGRQRTVLRGGFALTYERLRSTLFTGGGGNPPFVSSVDVRNGLASDPASGTASPRVPVALGGNIDPNLQAPRNMNWNLGIQQSVLGDAVFDITYAGSQGDGLTYRKDINQLPVGTLATVPLAPGVTNPNSMTNSLRPYKGYTSITFLMNGGIYRYHSLQTSFQKRFGSGGNIRAAYTWSKNLTDSHGSDYTPSDSFNVHQDYGPAYFNKPHVFMLSYSYRLPFWRDGGSWYKTALGDWRVSGITSYSSGLPINAFIANDVAGVGSNPSNGTALGVYFTGFSGNVQRADLIGDPYANTTRKQHLNPAAFAVPASVRPGTPFAGRYGTAGAYAFRGPRISNSDFTLSKEFPVSEQAKLEFRTEVFNVFNHLSYTAVNSQVGSPTFGQVRDAMDPRTFQFALRLTF